MEGTYGKYLRVDLSRGVIGEYAIPTSWQRLHLGGRGIAVRILLSELAAGADPLGPENLLVIASGPFQGTRIAGAGRYGIFGKSPKTRSVNESYAGGSFADALGRSGFDGVIVEGVSDDPVYLVIHPTDSRLESASSLWGRSTGETHEALAVHHPGTQAAYIGPAGERMIPFACVINDKSRASGRPGFGAVMGSKRLKAVVADPQSSRSVHDPTQLRQLSKAFTNWLRSDPATGDLHQLGTAGGLLGLNEMGMLPTRNFQWGVFAGAEKISGERMAKEILTGRPTCTGCPAACKRAVSATFAGRRAVPEYGGPEYETLAALGSLCMNDNLASIAVANQLCNAYGLDTISTGVLLACAMEATEKGRLSPGIAWGDAEAMLRTIDQMIAGTGLGGDLANGITAVEESLGIDFAVHIKGQEVPMHDPRGKRSLGISYATSPRGATHLEASHDEAFETSGLINADLGIEGPYGRLSWERKAELCKLSEDIMSFDDSLILCAMIGWEKSFGSFYPYPRVRELLASVTGEAIDAEEMLRIGERNYLIRKILAWEDGYDRSHDWLHARFAVPFPEGASSASAVAPDTVAEQIDAYYELRGMDRDGPTPERLRFLGLDELADWRDERRARRRSPTRTPWLPQRDGGDDG